MMKAIESVRGNNTPILINNYGAGPFISNKLTVAVLVKNFPAFQVRDSMWNFVIA
jgi:hypothetical protein